MKIAKRILVGRLLALLSVSLPLAPAMADQYLADGNGCKVWNPFPREHEKIAWNGACQDGFAQGQGTVQWIVDDQLSSTSEGNYVAGKRVGKGSQTSSSGSYEGDYADGYATGKGTYRWKNGDRYEGDFVDSVRTGKGKVVLVDGTTYQGDFVANRYFGKGILTWPNGDRYEGEFIQGQMTGKGTVTRANGIRIEGDFVDGKVAEGTRTGLGFGNMVASTTTPSGPPVPQSAEFLAWGSALEKIIGANFSRHPELTRADPAPGGVLEAHIDADGMPVDWKVKKSSGWAEFDETFLASAREAKPASPCPLVNTSIDIPFAYAAAVHVMKTYALSNLTTGSNIRQKEVVNILIPPEKTYAELSEEEKSIVKSYYEPMGDDDEPPYPLSGTIGILKAMTQLQDRLAVNGTLRVAVNIDENGRAKSVEVFQSPDSEMAQSAAAVLMIQKYKPAICGGVRCAMQYPFGIKFGKAP